MAKIHHLNKGYRLALEAAKQRTGMDRGAASWLAKYLKVDRQLLFYWSKNGFPLKYVGQVARLIGAHPDEISTTTVQMPTVVWKEITALIPKSLADQTTILNHQRRK